MTARSYSVEVIPRGYLRSSLGRHSGLPLPGHVLVGVTLLRGDPFQLLIPTNGAFPQPLTLRPSQKSKTGTSQQSRSDVKFKKWLLDHQRQEDAIRDHCEELPAVILAQSVPIQI